LKEERANQERVLGELAKLDPHEERSLADEAYRADTVWSEI
jgi:hypothetical protein